MSQQKFAVFDIDGTFFRWQLYHELVHELATMGIFSSKDTAELDTALLEWQARKRSWRDYQTVVVGLLERDLPNITTMTFEQAASHALDRSSAKVYHFTRQLAKDLKSEGYFLLALSGSMQEIAEPFAKLYDFDDCIGWVYETKDGKYTGKTVRNVLADKAKILRDYVKEHDLSWTDSIAIGDSGSDIGMLEAVERPIAFNPEERLLKAASEKNWDVIIERKNIAYHLEKGHDGTHVLAKTTVF